MGEQAERYRQDAQAAEQRAAAAEARADDARAETARVREDAGRERGEILARLTDTAGRLAEVTTAHAAELERVRADAARERGVLEELRGELVVRAERAERDVVAVRTELARLRQETGTAETPGASRRRRSGQSPE